VGGSSSRGDKPTEPSYSWLPEKWIEVQLPTILFSNSYQPHPTQRTPGKLVTGGTAPATQDTTLPEGLRSY